MNEIPTFTPPAPTFTPPAPNRGNGKCCHFHQNEQAVTKCARCGKPICQDCADNYQVNNDEFKDQPICYDCCKELVAQNVKELKKQRRKIIFNFIFTAIGMLFGGIISKALGSSEVPWYIVLLSVFIGGCLWTFIVNVFRVLKNTLKNFADGAWLGGLIRFFIDMIIAIFYAVVGTIKKIFTYTKYIIKTSGFIKSDTAALRDISEYMEYTQVRDRNVGVDLATLMNEGSELYNNSYAQSVVANGEENAQAALRNASVSINEHGEIIRRFDSRDDFTHRASSRRAA